MDPCSGHLGVGLERSHTGDSGPSWVQGCWNWDCCQIGLGVQEGAEGSLQPGSLLCEGVGRVLAASRQEAFVLSLLCQQVSRERSPGL